MSKKSFIENYNYNIFLKTLKIFTVIDFLNHNKIIKY